MVIRMSAPQREKAAREMAAGRHFLKRVGIRNYKSIEKCDIRLLPLTILVGRNGAGKSNFLDAIRFIVDGLETSLDHAIKSRGGIAEVRRRSTGHPHNFAIELTLELSENEHATYGFEIGSQKTHGFFVKQERLKVYTASYRPLASYHVEDGKLVKASMENMPPAASDRLYLVNAAGFPGFRSVYDALRAMGFYNLNPAAMKELQSPDAGELLHRNGANIASVIGRLSSDQPEVMDRIRSYLTSIVPSTVGVERVALGPKETIQFRQEVAGSEYPWRFFAANMSDGTLRTLGTLVAVTQLADRTRRVRLVGIEEPETALHPAAAGALVDALREAASQTQVVLTTHSPELIDGVNLDDEQLIAVQVEKGTTKLGPVDPASSQAIRNHLYTPGELLRMDQLEIDQQDLRRQQQLSLFDEPEDDK